VRPEHAQEPEAILAPYFACDGPGDGWWLRSRLFFDSTRAAAGGTGTVLRVVAGRTAAAVRALLDDVAPEPLIVWASGLDEHSAPASELEEYRRAIVAASRHGHETFALYGGFFSVLLRDVGLR